MPRVLIPPVTPALTSGGKQETVTTDPVDPGGSGWKCSTVKTNERRLSTDSTDGNEVFDSGYLSGQFDTDLRERVITSVAEEVIPLVRLKSKVQEDLRKFSIRLGAISKELGSKYTKTNGLAASYPYWITHNRYPVRQFRVYFLLGLHEANGEEYKEHLAEMTELEKCFKGCLLDLKNDPFCSRSVALDIYNYLAATQIFLKKSMDAGRTVNEGFAYAGSDYIVYSLQDARAELDMKEKDLLAGFYVNVKGRR